MVTKFLKSSLLVAMHRWNLKFLFFVRIFSTIGRLYGRFGGIKCGENIPVAVDHIKKRILSVETVEQGHLFVF